MLVGLGCAITPLWGLESVCVDQHTLSPTSAVFSRFSAVGSDKFFVFNVGVIIIENSDEYVASKKSISPLFFS